MYQILAGYPDGNDANALRDDPLFKTLVGHLSYAFGYATNNVLKRLVERAELDHEAKLIWWITGQQPWQTFRAFEDYQAESWSHPRRIITKVEVTKTGGINRRFVVTNLTDSPREIYREFYVQRGNVPERPIGELKNGRYQPKELYRQ